MLCLSRAGFMLYVIERAKKCLDFAATLYIIHLFICIVYGGWPASVSWWVVNITGLAIMALLGEYLCIRRELKEIPISRLRASKWFIHIKCLFVSFGYFVCTCRLHSNVFPYLVSLPLIFLFTRVWFSKNFTLNWKLTYAYNELWSNEHVTFLIRLHSTNFLAILNLQLNHVQILDLPFTYTFDGH